MLPARSSAETLRMQTSRSFRMTGDSLPHIAQLFKQPRWPLPVPGIGLRTCQDIIV
jgi:hypothetical protein